ncbi:MAG: hypothetical protein KGZ25_10010, partial [Planctomycetes bacterium]|nr:hypothetical protein [Planctomycetota bacterium]
MADERISEEELMDRWSISPTGLDRLIEDGHLKVKSEEEGTRYFDSYEIESVEAMKGGRDFVSAREAVEELGIPEDDLENAVDSGAATLYRFGDEARYARNRLEELRDKMGADVEDSSDKTQAINEDELFDFGDEIDAELGLEEEEES